MKARPLDERGYPVPYFVAWPNGKPDHRIVDPKKKADCVRFALCWLCGQPRGRFTTYIVGPMCAINRISSEPPSHTDCAEFSVKACPFLTRPQAQRRVTALPEGLVAPPGVTVERNPGVSLLWTTREQVKMVPDGDGGVLFRIGAPDRVAFYAEGRAATREEVLASIESGYPLLLDLARGDGDGAVEQLERMRTEALALVPA
jgi:hypothetical protein